MGTNSYLFNFKNEEDAMKCYEEGPWRVDGHMLSLQWWRPELSFEEISYNSLAIWIQVHALPLEKLNKNIAEKIGASLGRVLEVEDPYVDGNLLRKFLRVRVEVNSLEPLKTGFWFRRSDGSYSRASFKYERLCDYCYNCGRIGHDKRGCREVIAMDSENSGLPKYGPDLSVPGLRSITAVAENVGIRKKVGGNNSSKGSSSVARGEDTENSEWVWERDRREREAGQEKVDRARAKGIGTELHATRRFSQQIGFVQVEEAPFYQQEQQMEVEGMSEKKDTQFLENGDTQHLEDETKKDNDRYDGIVGEEMDGSRNLLNVEKGPSDIEIGPTLNGPLNTLQQKRDGVKPIQGIHKQKTSIMQETDHIDRNEQVEEIFHKNQQSTDGPGRNDEALVFKRADVHQNSTKNNFQLSNEKRAIRKTKKSENEQELDLDRGEIGGNQEGHQFEKIRAQWSQEKMPEKKEKQIHRTEDGRSYIVELADEEEEEEKYSNHATTVTYEYEIDLIQRIVHSLRLKRKREEEA
ncbi:hypothetical protein Ahy_B03g062307 [Arachis hypogaea]|uniref:CCHC-type domain-containing protein n=1 Tax=Arachis hypogaea TaxID=3818 RepID=A0A444ZU71_ARAHY|nr:hypothetical protein Ahy_B03g062307 [Arachis hypogaea]